MGQVSISFEFTLEKLSDEALGLVASALAPRVMTPIEHSLILSTFWIRAQGTEGDWVELALSESAARIVLELGFARGFVAQAMRMLGARRLELV